MALATDMLVAAHRSAAAISGGRIRYASGQRSCEITEAIRGQTEYETIDPSGAVRTEFTDADFLLVRDDLVLGAQLHEPLQGDQVTLLDPGPDQGAVFEVLPPPGRQCWRRCDPHGALIRVHTKLILDPEEG